MQAAPALLDLNVNGCIHLARLLLPSNLSLQQLDISGCGMLRQLDSSASTLQSLTAHGCDNLHVSWSKLTGGVSVPNSRADAVCYLQLHGSSRLACTETHVLGLPREAGPELVDASVALL